MYHSNGLHVIKLYVHSKFGKAYPNIKLLNQRCACNSPNINGILSPCEVII